MKTLSSKNAKSWLALLVAIVFIFSTITQLPVYAEDSEVYAQNNATGFAVDFSFENPRGGFGIGSDGTYGEIYRYQTFTAPISGTLKDVSLFINQKYSKAGPHVSDLIVEIYETEETDGAVLPVGEYLKQVKVPKENLKYNMPSEDTEKATLNMVEELIVEINLEGIVKGKRYAVAVTQEKTVPWDSEGGNYLWPTGNVAAAKDEHFGKKGPGGWADESFLGTGWLKVNIDESSTKPINEKIDFSFENPKGGFGIGSDGTFGEIYRYQTFTAPISGTLKDVSLFINQKYSKAGPHVSDLIVEIYETEETDGAVLPVGEYLKQVKVPKENLKYNMPSEDTEKATLNMVEELIVEINLEGIVKGKRYAVAVTQEKTVPWDSEGGNYLWPTGNVAAAKDEHFGKKGPGGWADESFLGTGWLKVNIEGNGSDPTDPTEPANDIIDFSFENPGNGFGVGTPSEIYRYQTFTATKTGTLESITVWLNKRYEARDQIEPISDLIIEIYKTEQSGDTVIPTGSPIKSVTIPRGHLTFTVPQNGSDHAVGGEFTFNINCPDIEKGKRYAVALTQKTLPVSDVVGEHYRWPTGNVATAAGEHFGKKSPSGWADESFLGTGWLKVTLSDKIDTNQRPSRVEITPSPSEFIYIPIGETLQPQIKVYDQNGNEMYNYLMVCDIDKSDVASVDPATGSITAIKGGKAVVRITIGNITSRLYIETYDPVPHRIRGDANISIKAGESETLDYEVVDDMKNIRPELKKDIKFEIENSEIAVIENGVINGILPGSTTMKVSYGSLVKYVSINVYSDDENLIEPVPGMIITENVKFKPGEYVFTGNEGIIIGADNIVVDGNGAVIRHNGGFGGTGIYLEGRKNVTIKNINVHGFNIGICVNGGENLLIEYCDFSDNYNDPSYGWGDGYPYGATRLINMNNSTIRYCNGNNVWNGLNLEKSNSNNVYCNDFSVCGNVAMKLWGASFNRIYDNIFSWGLRMDPGEVHARDSTSSLIEFTSHYNYIARNDFTHGGDGIFIRPLHGASPIGNYFFENDASWANNNAVESWSPGNVYVRNKANYSSYGFWLGGSDFTYLIDNEVMYNGGSSGRGMQNAPEAFGNAGVSVVSNTSTNFMMMGNIIKYNYGPGVAIKNESSSVPAYHWLVQNNTITDNLNDPRGYKAYGIYTRTASWVDIISNKIENNGDVQVKQDINSHDIIITGDNTALSEKKPPKARLNVTPAIMSTHKDMYYDLIPDEIKNAEYGFMDIRYISVEVGEEITFDASASEDPQGLPLEFRWELGDGTIETGEKVTHIYRQPGIYRGGMTVKNGELGDLIGFVVTVYDKGNEIGTEESADEWNLIMPQGGSADIFNFSGKLVEGEKAIKVEATSGMNYQIIYPASKKLDINFADYDGMSFFIDTIVEYGRNGNNRLPIVRLKKDDRNYIEFVPTRSYMNYDPFAMYITEIRYSYHYMYINLNGDSEYFRRNVVGDVTLDEVNYIEFVAGPNSNGYSSIAIDALKLLKANSAEDDERFSPNLSGSGQTPIYYGATGDSNTNAPLINDTLQSPVALPKFTANGEGAFYGVEFTEERFINKIEAFFYYNPTESGFENVAKPTSIRVEYWENGEWKPVSNPVFSPATPTSNLNTVTFDLVETKKVRIVPTVPTGKCFSIYGFKVYNTLNYIGNKFSDSNKERDAASSVAITPNIQKIGVFLNKKIGENGAPITDLIVGLYNTEGQIVKGSPLKTITVPVEDVKSGEETVIDFPYEGLELGKRYAIALSQVVPAPEYTDGHYLWPVDSIGVDEYYGKMYDMSTGDSVHEPLGIGWLKVYMDNTVIDYSHNKTKSGYGVGCPTELGRYQTFTIPFDKIYFTMDGSISQDNIWSTDGTESDEHWIEYDMGKMRNINTIQIYLANNSTLKLPKKVSIEYLDGAEWKLLKSFTGDDVSERIRFINDKDISTRKVRVSIVEQPGTASGIREVEIMKYTKKSGSNSGTIPAPVPIQTVDDDSEGEASTKDEISATKEELDQQLESKGYITLDCRYGSIIIPGGAYEAFGLMPGEKLSLTIQPSNQVSDELLECYDIKLSVGDRKIESLGDNRILILIDYENKLNLQEEAIIGVFIDEDGIIHTMPLSYYEEELQKVVISTDHLSTFGIKYNLKTFKDTLKHWAKEYIDFLAGREIVAGIGDGTFAPDQVVTRAEFVKMLSGVVAAELDQYNEIKFADVPSNKWYTNAIAWAVANNIAKGYGNGNFGPNDNITREQMAVMAVNFAKAMGLQLASTTEEIEFADAEEISDYAKEAVKALQMSGIISGKGNNIFDPKGTATRAEAAKIISLLVKAMVK